LRQTEGIDLVYIDTDALELTKINAFEKRQVAWDGQYLWHSSDAQ